MLTMLLQQVFEVAVAHPSFKVTLLGRWGRGDKGLWRTNLSPCRGELVQELTLTGQLRQPSPALKIEALRGAVLLLFACTYTICNLIFTTVCRIY